MKRAAALVQIMTLLSATSPAPPRARAARLPLACPHCGTTVYRAGSDVWFCGRCAIAVQPIGGGAP